MPSLRLRRLALPRARVIVVLMYILLSAWLSGGSPPTGQPAGQPSGQPSRQPTGKPTRKADGGKDVGYTRVPTGQPSRQPSRQPSGQPSRQPTRQPTGQPSRRPSRQPTSTPTTAPSHQTCFGCASGKFYSSVKDVGGETVGCTACLPGYTCQGGCKLPVACAVGKYAASYSSTSCSACQRGTYNLLQASSSCSMAPPGYSANFTTSSPTICGKGFYSPGGGTACFTCEAGTYAGQSGLSICSPCPPGFFCAAGSQSPISCQQGYYSTGAAGACTYCAAGTYCPSPATAATPCTPGTYSLGGASACTVTPQGSYSPVSNQPPILCSVGYFSTGSGQTSCTPAPSGSFVPTLGAGSSTFCPVGTYTSGGAASVCTQCNPGYMCPQGSSSASVSPCSIGGYCNPAGTYTRCPPGSYGTITAGQNFLQACTYCKEGYYCSGNTGLIGDQQACQAGFYCATGSSYQTACPAGTASPYVMQTTISTCAVCTKGTYCLAGSSASRECPKNFFCGVGTGDYLQFPCAPGTYGLAAGLFAGTQCTNCTTGHYCPGGVDPLPCPQGSYNAYFGGSSIFSCSPCPAGFACPSTGMSVVPITNRCLQGYFCPPGSQSTSQFPCAAGSFSDSFSLTSQSGCTQCPAGFTCAEASVTASWQDCSPGFYCPIGTARGSAIPCPAGTYSSLTKRTKVNDCLPCTAGSYCLGEGSMLSGTCAQGFYCPTNSTSPTANPCPAGTYTTSTSLTSSASCTTTSVGYYTLAGASIMTPCPAGRYTSVTNTAAASQGAATPYCLSCPAGSYCIVASTGPTSCGPGFYSAASASVCTICPKGTYCSSSTTTAAMLTTGGGTWAKISDLSGVCFPGTLCGLGETAIPNLSTRPVAAGNWAPAGATSALPCPAGTYVAQTGSSSLANCTITSPGYYSLSASTAPTGLCVPGYYCLAGSTSPQQTPCPAGTYSSVYGAESRSRCSFCIPGSYCPIASSTLLTCPRGFYCPTATSEPEPCPPSTYGATSGLRSASECTICDPGSYCDGYGLQSPRGLCSPGFFCISGSNSSAPLQGVFFGRCPRGAYCGLGTVAPILCSEGTFNGNEGGKSAADCTPCPAGKFCEGQGNAAPTGFCIRGFYCTGSAKLPTQSISQPGYFSLAGAVAQLPCIAGTYNNLNGQYNCTACVAGYYCPTPAMTTYVNFVCPSGRYCGRGAIVPVDCPPGTYSSSVGNTQLSDCRACDGGFYCRESSNSAVTGPCRKGYYCLQGASSPVQNQLSATGGPCTAGHYCPNATAMPIPCPVGTYQADLLNTGEIVDASGRLHFCTPCPAGKACTITGLTAPNAICGAGYWCAAGASNVNASCTSASCALDYGLCPKGSYCTPGSATPTACLPGSYQNNLGKSFCKQCPERYACGGGASNYTICPVTRYCQAGSSTGLTCSDGTYSNKTGLALSSECTPCPAKQFCTGGIIRGACNAGYFCKTSQAQPNPFHSTSAFTTKLEGVNYLLGLPGGQCPAGHYCPQGCSDPIPCADGTKNLQEFRSSPADCGPCPAGATCRSSNPVPEVCPVGQYCVGNGAVATPCPIGTYNDLTGRSLISDCKLCPPGFHCDGMGIAQYLNHPCPVGKYCLAGTGASGTAPINCPEGTFLNATDGSSVHSCKTCTPYHYCVEGAVYPRVCPNGFYCSVLGKGSPCPPTKYCPFGTSTPVSCPQNYHCPGNTSAPILCQFGTYCPALSAFPISCPLGYKAAVAADGTHDGLHSLASACVACPPGTYGTDPQRLVCHIGTPGYVFLGGTITAKPLNVTMDKGFVCPVGHYCSAGSSTIIPCPVGTYQPFLGKGNFSDCLSCAVGTYQYKPASATCLKCSSSSTSKARATSCTCVGLNRAFQPTDGMCICQPGYQFVDANLKVSSNEDGAYDCQPIVYSRCATGSVRDSTGKCVSESVYCNNFCGASVGGRVDPSTGTCDCTTIATVNDVCDSTCRASKPTISCQNGMLLVTDPTTGHSEHVDPKTLATDGAGALDCSVPGSNVLTMSTASGTFKGIFGAPASVSAQLRRRRLFSTSSSNTSNYLQLQNHRELGSDPSLSNPIVCIHAGDSIVFSVSNGAYPIYQKDSLLNSNPNFDYGAFRDLATLAASTKSISTFPFTFTQEGTYAFALGSSSSITVISVISTTVTCSTGVAFAELSKSNLAKLGVLADNNFILVPEWNLVVGLLLGILGLVILIAIFLYYFRRRAWNWHEPIEPKYRQNNKTLGEPKPSKGGVWSSPITTWPSWGAGKDESPGDMYKRKPKPKGQKMIQKQSFWDFCCGRKQVAIDEEDARFDGGDDDFREENDIDTALAKKNTAESEFEDDMLIPELAKHMQEQHDKIDRQLAGQKDMMKKLRNTLRKEIDELKALLSSTALEMSSVGGSDAARMKKLRALLLEVKGNTTQASSFEGGFETGELRLVSVCEKMLKMMDGGAGSLMNEIVQELASNAVTAQERDESTSSLISSTLHNLLTCLAAFSSLAATQLQSAAEEKRRTETATASFNHSLKVSHVVFPDNILELMNECEEAAVTTGSFAEEILSITKAFSDKHSLFSSTVLKCEGGLSQCLINIVEQGANAVLDKEKSEKVSELTDYLSEFLETTSMVMEKLTGRREAAASPRERHSYLRTDLINAIDAELSILASTQTAPDFERLLAALQDGVTVPSGKSDTQMKIVATVDGVETIGQLNRTEIDAVINNDGLTMEQKEQVLGSAETDRMVMQNMIEMQRKAQEQLQHDVLQAGERREGVADDNATLASRNAEEAATLEARLKNGRDAKLEAMMRCEYFANLDSDSPHDVRVATISVNRYTAILRCHSAKARFQYQELRTRYQRKKLDVCQMLAESANSTAVLEQINIYDNPEIVALDNALEQDFSALTKRLQNECAAAVATEDALRATWQKNPSAINVESEMQRLSNECEQKFLVMQRDYERLCSLLVKMDEDEEKVKFKLFLARCAEYPDDEKKEALNLLYKEIETNHKACAQKCKELFRTLTSEHDSLEIILSMSDCWGPKIAHSKVQGELFLRILTGIQISADIRLRLALTEHQLKSEVQQIKTENDLRKRNATKQELQVTWKNLNDAALESASVLAASMQVATSKAVAEEKQRQELCIVDFERERADAIERNAQSQLRLSLDIAKSRRSMRTAMSEILAEKAKVLAELQVPPTLLNVNKKQILSECIREEFELNAAYTVLELESMILAVYSSEMIEGLSPSVGWAQPSVRDAASAELRVLLEAMINDKSHKRLGKQLMSGILAGLEESRLMRLDRPAEDLAKVYSDMESRLFEQYKLIDSSWSKEKDQLFSMQAGQTNEKLLIHEKYAEAVSLILENYEERRADLKASFAADMKPIKEQERTESVKEKLILTQAYCGHIVSLNVATEEKLVEAFAACNAKLRMILKLEDDLRLIRNNQQQTSEAMENSNDSASMNAYFTLLEQQTMRHNQAKKMQEDYDLEVNGLNAVMAARKKQQAVFLQQRLEKKKEARERELQKQGLSAADASTQAAKEQEKDKKAVAQAAAAELEAQAKALRKGIDSSADSNLAQIQSDFKKAQAASESGLVALHIAEKAALDGRLKARKLTRQNELIANGKTPAIAKKLAERELTDIANAEGDSLNVGHTNFEAALKKDIEQFYASLEDQMRKGYAEEMKKTVENSSLSQAETKRLSQKLDGALTEELCLLKEQRRLGQAIVESGWSEVGKSEQERLQAKLRDSRAARKADLMENQGLTERETNAQLDATEETELRVLASVLQAAKRANVLAAKEARDALVQALQIQRVAKLKGIEDSLAFMMSEGKKTVVEKAAKRRELRERMIVSCSLLNSKEAKSLLDTEQELLLKALLEMLERQGTASAREAAKGQMTQALTRASEALSKEKADLKRVEDEEMAEFLEVRQVKLAKIMQTTENNTASLIAAVNEASKAALELQDSANLQSLRRAHEEAFAAMQERLKQTRAQEEKALKARLEQRKKQRTEELRKENVPIESIAATLALEEKKLVDELAQSLQAEEDKAAALLAMQSAEAERAALEKERACVSDEVKQKTESNQAAQAKVEELRNAQEIEFKRLLEAQRADREANERHLKARLAEKKEAKLKLLADKKANSEECAIETMRLVEEEHARITELERERAEEEQRALDALRREQENALSLAVKEAARLELEAAAAASKSSVLATMQENLIRAEAEMNAKEMKRVRDLHELNASQAAAEAEQRKGAKHTKLEERLQAKREKKRQELAEQEERARAELSTRQIAEAEERNMLQREKERWVAALQEAMSRAAAANLSSLEREDYLLKEILGPKAAPVPASQHKDVVQEVLKARHNEETSTLLDAQGAERIAALRTAVETCIAEKGQARIALIERLNNENASADQIASETSALDSLYSAKQLEAEKKTTDALDPTQLRRQMDLKEKQIQEIGRLVRAYTDPEALAATAEKNYLEDLAAYRANLEAQKEARKDSLLKERQEAEIVLRQEMEKEMRVMQEQLAAEQRKVEEDLEAKKKMLLKQKEEVDKKHAEELSELDNQEAGKMREKFEKEHAAALDALEAERLNKKARLQDRLAKKRKNIPVEAEVSTTMAAELIATASENQDEPREGESLDATNKEKLKENLNKMIERKKDQTSAGTTGQADPTMMKALTGFMRKVEKKLESLDKAMSSLSSFEHPAATKEKYVPPSTEDLATAKPPTATAAATTIAYKDSDEPPPGDLLVVIKPENLHVQERTRVDFGLKLAGMLGLSRLRIKAASSLPTNNSTGNAFANSYAYVHEDATLFVHINRLGTSGDVGVIMIHALSHIKVNPKDLSNDADPAFLSIFYRSLKILSQDLYRSLSSSAQLTSVTPQLSTKENSMTRQLSIKDNLSRASSFVDTLTSPSKDGREMMRRDLSIGGPFSPTGDEGTKTSSSGVDQHSGTSGTEGVNYFSEDNLKDRMLAYAKESGGAVPEDFLQRYFSTSRTTKK